MNMLMTKVDGIDTAYIPANDRGLAYGDGVWETIVIRHGKLKQLDRHMRRLLHGLSVLGIVNVNIQAITKELHRLEAESTDLIVKVIVTRGDTQRGYVYDESHPSRWIISTHDLPTFPTSYTEQGIKLFHCQTRLAINPRLAGFKHLNRLEQVLARAEFSTDYQEGLVSDYEDHIIEGTMSNIFVVTQDNRILTPDLSASGIAGVARSCIIQHCHELGQKVLVKPLTHHDINAAKGLFLCNSVIKIWPVKQYQQSHFSIPKIIRALQAKANESL